MKNLMYLLSICFLILLVEGCTVDNEDNSSKPEPVIPKAEYTEEEAGEWESIKSEHLPEVTYTKESGKHNFVVMIPGRNYNETHQIEKIGIFNEDKIDLVVESKFDSAEPKAILSLKEMPANLQKSKIFVKCNLHDLWTIPLEQVITKKNK